MNADKTYTFRIHADFEAKTVSFQLKEKDGDVLAQQLDIPTDAVNLAKMNECSWWASKAQYIDNFRLTAPEKDVKMPLKGKTVYAFGDSIVAGHQYQKASFADFAASAEGMTIQKFAVNGATVMDANYDGGRIAAQVEKAPAESPDYILFDGGTNDAEYIANNQDIQYGEVTDAKDAATFDSTTFAGAFESLVYQMQQKYPDAQLVYTAVHKLGSRDNAVQEKLRAIELAVCEKYGVAVADVYEKLDTNDVNKKNDYTFNSLAANGLPGNNGSGTHPNLKAIEEFYVPVVTTVLEGPASYVPDVEKPVIVDKTALESKLNEAKAEVDRIDVYTEESLSALRDAIEAAQKVFDDSIAKQSDVNEQTNLVKEALTNLVRLETESVDKSVLEAKLNEAKKEAEKTDTYTEDSMANLSHAITEAEEGLAREDLTQEQADELAAKLEEAINGLEKISKPVPDTVDRSALADKISEAEKLSVVEDVYTAESMSALKQAVSDAKAVYDNADASQEEIDAQVAVLQAAIDGLKKADAGKPEEEKPGQGGSGNQEQKPDSVTQKPDDSSGSNRNNVNPGNANKSNNPKTGDDTNIIIPAVTCGIALILIIATIATMLRKKRR